MIVTVVAECPHPLCDDQRFRSIDGFKEHYAAAHHADPTPHAIERAKSLAAGGDE